MAWLKKLVGAVIVLGGAAAAAGWVLSAPVRLDAVTVAQLGPGDAAKGKRIFYAGGCTSCHAKPGSQGDGRLQLTGGLELKTPFGTFVPPNISQDQRDGIGAWSEEDFANAMLKGVSPSGEHFYPAFPYASYARMKPADIADLYAFMKTLPAVAGKAPDHKLSFPFNIRRGIGLWKRLYLSPEPVIALPDGTPGKVLAGRYLAEGPGHCGECHTPRDFAGGAKKGEWLAGAVAAEGAGVVPNITPDGKSIKSWSEADIANYLETGFTPDFDSVGGAMVEVQKNMAQLSADDRAAIAAYLKAVPPHPNGYPARKPAS
ncbi:c-type cytochrome [Mesorhizobium sp. M2D.F.Ca.ET.185.01.1.1]|uniref:cytochrome c n=1 Tax=unclassified Mesorhizobium TaxID=325217 RepID=UPI000FCB1AFE|nr:MULTISPECIES: cytochrome c [unclassified Mesorhizobium]TGP76315.1 c-type cytochrome [bacterium M00.F.Ca.ET.227.01.1.1]TGP92369.1 c-type cytochrome [bacterium M00.F.Ca.ET.222.01.1.1]TGP96923.1 c-type cytochrome [bacterium M00.F.Ca.ET.221.01.1.1]TGT69054.1 c-type cytochrome [bacterium M00.F.Ca.ET.159.01.1.1]TGT80917.1 c-type cytochrome [bacterium M00.F.Ca.ET.157.01.1.1]TGU06616.1 c-type cytochrome [bacterium M00.F.Ca.ET.163.01.1.1]TGU27756.1 c-type cytochrome [bacterium M00.F.Ca.ET.156.01.1